MSFSIFILLILSSFGHATWNAISKKIEDRDTFFTLILGIASIQYLPVAILLWQAASFPAAAWKWVAISTMFEILYFVTLAKTYRRVPYTSAYPVVRGTAPLITTIFAFVLGGSAVSITGLLGILMIVAGILFTGQTRFSIRELYDSFRSNANGLGWGLLTGIFIAGYNLSDAAAAQLMSALIAGLLVFGANSIAVYSMQSTSVAYVASVREMSIVFSALIGWIWLKEKIHSVKWISIGLILLGVLLIKIQ